MSEFDAYHPDFVADPYPTYQRLRAESPVFYDETWSLTFFTRHADVNGMLKDRRFGRDVRQGVPLAEVDPEVYARIYPDRYPNWTKYIRGSFIDLEPPRHTRLRRLVQWAFSRRSSESYRPRLQETAASLIEQARERGTMEAISGYATPIPLAMIGDLLGIPSSDQPQLVQWSHAIVRVFDQACTPAEGVAAEEAVVEFVEYLRELLAERRRRPGDDLLTALIASEHEGDRLDDDELIATCILTLNAGHEATVQAIGNALLALAGDPAAYQDLVSRPELVPTAAEELLRFDTPLQMFERWALEDCEWAGWRLKRGSKVGLLFGSANRDEEVFRRPEAIDLARSPNPHISFGAGTHYCVGAPLAKVELEVALAEFSRRVEHFEVLAEPERVPSLVFRGVKALELGLS